jgi:hypothetical protein
VKLRLFFFLRDSFFERAEVLEEVYQLLIFENEGVEEKAAGKEERRNREVEPLIEEVSRENGLI